MRVGGEWAYVCLLAGLANRGITGHSAGRARDASLVLGESTNRLLKKELIYRNHHTGLEQPRSGLNDYVRWSDDQRLRSTPGYRSPNEFTQQGLVL